VTLVKPLILRSAEVDRHRPYPVGMASSHDALLHPFSYPSKSEADYINIVRGEGVRVFDDVGKSYIDGIASLWLCQVGHGRREVIEAITDQLGQLASYNVFDPMTNPIAGAAAERIASVSPHPDGRVFLASSGSESIDTALKMVRLVQQRRGHPDKQIIIRRTRGYHGTNFGGTSAQGIEGNRVGWGDLLPHFVEVAADDLEAVSVLFAEHGANIAGVITEPVQGAGGVWPPPNGYLDGLRRLCDQHGALLVFDEVICGFGRTGSWFAAQTFDVTPDLITFAKGVTSGYLPVSGVIVSPGLGEELSEPGFKLMTGYTYSGHPACCAAAIANIDVIEADGLCSRANHIGARFEAGLAALAADNTIAGYRGVGAIWAAELGRDTVGVRNRMLERGVIVRPIGTSLAICPPLIISDEDIDIMLDTMVEAMSEVS